MRTAVTVLFCGIVALPLFAQNPHIRVEVNGIVSPEGLGGQNEICGLGDVDGDGIPDFAAGALSWPMPNPGPGGGTIAQVGRAGVYSGATGALIFSVYGTYNLQALGRSVANVGDLDGDGRNDVAIGAPMFGPIAPGGNPPPQQVQVWSTGTHQLLFTILGGAGGFSSQNFGYAIAGIGDVGGLTNNLYSAIPDGHPDILVGAPAGNAAFVYSGLNGALLYAIGAATLNGGSTLVGTADNFGEGVAAVGDVNGDGIPDFVIGARTNTLGGTAGGLGAGAAFLLSGNGGALIAVLTGAPGDAFGASVAGIGDVNNDGFPDFAVGATKSDGGGVDTGSVTAFSGLTHAPLWTTNGLVTLDNFGYAVAGGGDVNRDGVPDVVVGTPTTDIGATNTGSVTVLDGATGAMLGTLHGGNASDLRGRSVAFIGDVEADGSADVVVGTPGTDVGGSSTGSAAVVSFGPFLRPCAAGDIPATGSGTFDMLNINGSAGGAPRRIDVGTGQPFTLSVLQPPAFPGAAGFYAFACFGLPLAGDEGDPGYGVGTLCFLPPAFRPGDPRLFVLADSLLGGDPNALIQGASTAPWSASFPAGLPFQADIAVQAVTLGGTGYLRSNAVLLSVR